MSALLSIGEFSRMTFLSVKTLRFYHDVGLLPAAEVDPVSGYRRYRADQASSAHVVRRLRDLSMGIDDIAAVLNARDIATRNEAISDHLRAMEEQLHHTGAAVSSLRRLLEGSSRGEVPVVFESMAAHDALAITTTIVDGESALTWRRDAARELRALLQSVEDRGIRRAGPDAALYSTELLEDERGPMTVLLPVTTNSPAGMRVAGTAELTTVPAREYATATHRGSPDDLDRVFTALGTTVAQNAIGVPGPIREDYLVSELDTAESNRWQTTIRWPIFRTTNTPANRL